MKSFSEKGQKLLMGNRGQDVIYALVYFGFSGKQQIKPCFQRLPFFRWMNRLILVDKHFEDCYNNNDE